MTGIVAGLTPNFQLSKIAFDARGWDAEFNRNLSVIDAALFAATGLSGIGGVWQNSTAYAVGNRVTDEDSGSIFQCAVAHTSSATGTFEEHRTANPTHWNALNTVPVNRGQWTTSVAYNVNDYVIDNSRFAVCKIAHTSTTSLDADIANWEILVNLLTDQDQTISEAGPGQRFKRPTTVANPTNTNFNTYRQGIIDEAAGRFKGQFIDDAGANAGDVFRMTPNANGLEFMEWLVSGSRRWDFDNIAYVVREIPFIVGHTYNDGANTRANYDSGGPTSSGEGVHIDHIGRIITQVAGATGDNVVCHALYRDTTRVMDVTADGDLRNTNGSFSSLSDEREKKQISKSDPVLEKVLSIDVVDHSWRDETMGGRRYHRFTAQNVMKVFPENVRHYDIHKNKKRYSVDMMAFIPIVVQAIQELHKDMMDENHKLRVQIEKLQGASNV